MKYGMATVSAIAAAFAGVAALSFPQALAGDHMGASQASDLGMEGQSWKSWVTERAKNEYAIQKQECDTLKNSQPEAYEPCLEKARSARSNLLTQTQGSEDAGQGSQGSASSQSQGQLAGQEQGPIDKMTSAVKETVAEVKEKLFGSSDQGQPGQGQQGQGFAQGQPSQQGGGSTPGPNPLQQSFEASHMQGQGLAQQNLSTAGGQGGQNFGQQGQFQSQQGQPGQGQGSFQGGNYGQQPQGQSGQQGTGGAANQQFYAQQGQSDQGSFQGGQQSQGQPCPQGTGGTKQQFQSGGTQGLQGSANQHGGSRSGWVGEKENAHMDRGEYYQAMARQQYATLKQECNTLKTDPNVYEQCQKHAESVREKLLGIAEQS
ncbi:MAG: hypothetical protein ACREXS_12655 [Gammaproteobacteria bacterium]